MSALFTRFTLITLDSRYDAIHSLSDDSLFNNAVDAKEVISLS